MRLVIERTHVWLWWLVACVVGDTNSSAVLSKTNTKAVLSNSNAVLSNTNTKAVLSNSNAVLSNTNSSAVLSNTDTKAVLSTAPSGSLIDELIQAGPHEHCCCWAGAGGYPCQHALHHLLRGGPKGGPVAGK